MLLAPSSDGYLGAWLVAGPLPRSLATTIDPAAVLPAKGKSGGLTFQLRDVKDGALDLRKALNTGQKRGHAALVGGTLDLSQPLDGWLLVGVDGALAVYVDGVRLFARSLPQLRGRSWDFVPLALGKGRHRVVFRLEQSSEHWAFMARVLDRQRFLPPRGFSLLLEGTTDADADRLAASLQTRTFWTGLDAQGYRPGLALEYRRGVPRQVTLATRVRAVRARSGEALFDIDAGPVHATERGAHRFEVSLPRIPAAALTSKGTEAIRLDLRTGSVRTSRSWFVSGKAPAIVARAEALLSRPKAAEDARQAVVLATLQQRLARAKRLGIGARANAGSLERALIRLQDWVTRLENGEDPLRSPGLSSLARRSELDGSLQRFLLHVPRGVEPNGARRYPLIVVLHGYGGTPTGVLSAFFDSRAESPSVWHPSFVLAPHAHGNAFYRGPGEHEVLRTLAWVREHYPIDADRVTITGVSMGGTGAAELGLRHADEFAAASPLCGYHSYFVRRDIRGLPLRAWERDQMLHYSPASFAENGRHLPLFVAHGLKDFPLENSRVLIERYRALGQRVSEDWPDVGHAVWEEYWKGGRMWPVLAAQKRGSAPSRVTLKTDSLRTARQYWVRLHAFAAGARLAQIDAQVLSSGEVLVRTSGAAAIELSPPETLVRSGETRRLTIDGHAVQYAPGAALLAQRGAAPGAWVAGLPAQDVAHKRARLEGPIRDVYLEPLVFVFGTLDPATWRANRELADTLARSRFGPGVHYRVMADRDLTPELEQEHSLFLVGNVRDHALLRALGTALPAGVDGAAVRFGSRRHTSHEVGALFVHPNPRARQRYLLTLTAPTLPGAFRALSLPALLPDFVVYDARVAPATSEQVLGAAEVVEAGYFNADWSVPAFLKTPGPASSPQPASGPAVPVAPSAASGVPTPNGRPARNESPERVAPVSRLPSTRAPASAFSPPARQSSAAPSPAGAPAPTEHDGALPTPSSGP